MVEKDSKYSEKDILAKKTAIWSQLISIGIDFAVYLGAPLFLFVYAGKWMDSRYHHKFFVLIGLFLALGLSSYLIYKKIKAVKDMMDNK
jgi:hypothetical protein